MPTLNTTRADYVAAGYTDDARLDGFIASINNIVFGNTPPAYPAPACREQQPLNYGSGTKYPHVTKRATP
jgi:hypothetical protein